MRIKHVSKRASKAMYALTQSSEKFTELLHVLDGEENLQIIIDGLNLIEEAQQELVKILAQDNDVEVEG